MHFPDHLFSNRKLVIATKHKKEEVIAPLFKSAFNVDVIVPKDLDTDLLGTFSGEIERESTPIQTLKKKCVLALEHTGLDLVVASEGSFGNHPSAFFLKADEELVMLMDTSNNIEIIGREISTSTNFAGKNIASIEELQEFCKEVSFPSHALILKPGEKTTHSIIKGITSEKELLKEYERMMENHATVFVETDMRALYNPTRMSVIEIATKKLIKNIESTCSACNAPGFVVSDVIGGLPCELCGHPTKSTLYHVYTCKQCNYSAQKKYPLNKKEEDPQYCDYCNP